MSMAGESENLEVEGSLIEKDGGKGLITVGVLDSDLYLHASCTHGSDVEMNDNVGFDGTIQENKDVSSAKGGFEDSQGVRSLEGKSENEIAEMDGNDATLKALDEQDSSHKGVNEILEKEVVSDVIPIESDVMEASIPEKIGSHEEQEVGEEEFNDAEQSKTAGGKVVKRAAMKSSGKNYQASYQLPREKEGQFSVYDIVWGKVRSHPWWPGQIFDPSDSSEQAMKHFKKDSYLVAYYWDGTFAWNEASKLKSFRTNFSCIEKQSKSEAFRNAVDCALDEVKRRVEFGLACSCIPKNIYNKIKLQNFENCGIRRELSVKHRVDESSSVSSFLPEKLVEYLKALSKMPTGGFDRLELLIAKAQLLAFYRFKGFSSLPELQYCGGIDNDIDNVTNDTDKKMSGVDEHTIHASKSADQTATGSLKTTNGSCRKRKRNLKDGVHLEKKKSRTEPTCGTPDSNLGDCEDDEVIGNLIFPVLSKKRKKVDHRADVSGTKGRRTASITKVPSATKQSFRIGECILRVANQLTSLPSISRCSGDKSQMADRNADDFSGNGFDVFSNLEETHKSNLTFPTEFSSLHDLLFLLQWVAREPRGDYSFLNVMASFFSDFRNSIILADDSGKEILPTNEISFPEAFEFDDLSETYCTDMVMQNGSEEQQPQRSSKLDHQHVPSEQEKHVHVYTRRSFSRKQSFDSNHVEIPEKPSGYLDKKSPAELVLDFAELESVPSETSLNNIFRHFGHLEESETEIDRANSRARVVFKKCADAVAAFSSAKKLNIFRPILVNYQLNYSPSSLFEASSLATKQDQKMHIDPPDAELMPVMFITNPEGPEQEDLEDVQKPTVSNPA